MAVFMEPLMVFLKLCVLIRFLELQAFVFYSYKCNGGSVEGEKHCQQHITGLPEC